VCVCFSVCICVSVCVSLSVHVSMCLCVASVCVHHGQGYHSYLVPSVGAALFGLDSGKNPMTDLAQI